MPWSPADAMDLKMCIFNVLIFPVFRKPLEQKLVELYMEENRRQPALKVGAGSECVSEWMVG